MKVSRKFLNILLVGVLAFCFTKIAYAALADVNTSVGAPDVYEINNATPGTSKTFLGTRLRGLLQQGGTTVSASSSPGPTALTASYQTYVYTSSASIGNSYALANGYVNETVTFVLATDGGKDIIISPNTKSGFTDIHLDDAKDSCTLKYIDSTTGWVVSGNNGCTVN